MDSFHVVPGSAVSRILASSRKQTIAIVAETYLAHARGESINPDSHFLRFPDDPTARIIALPAALTGASPVAGIKWIASYPKNVERNVQRASAVLILNDYETGYPLACLEASQISAARTAASAAVAARALKPGWPKGGRLALVGAGVIARTIVDYLCADGWSFDQVAVHDVDAASARALRDHASAALRCPAGEEASAESCVSGADVVVLATSALAPHIDDVSLFVPGQLVLNISLRDLAPEIILASDNVFDDVEHCLKANTSPHLAEQRTGSRDFARATLAQALQGDKPDGMRPVVFSPFGLGILDLAVGAAVLARAIEGGMTSVIPGFFSTVQRWES